MTNTDEVRAAFHQAFAATYNMHTDIEGCFMSRDTYEMWKGFQAAAALYKLPEEGVLAQLIQRASEVSGMHFYGVPMRKFAAGLLKLTKIESKETGKERAAFELHLMEEDLAPLSKEEKLAIDIFIDWQAEKRATLLINAKCTVCGSMTRPCRCGPPTAKAGAL